MLAVPPRFPCDPITGETPIEYDYDGQGRETRIERPATSSYDASLITIAYDALGRRASETQDGRTVAWQYDIAGRPTRLTWPDAWYVTYDHSPAAQLTAIRDSGGAALISYGYDAFGRPASLTRANGRVTALSFDPVARLSRLHQIGLAVTDLTYNPASQILTRTLSHGAWDGDANLNRNYARNSLNQYTSVGGVAFAYDLTGNLTDDGPNSYAYDPENRMKWSVRTDGATPHLRYDGRGRLRRRWGSGAGTTDYLYDGDAMIAELNGLTGAVVRRYIHGAGVDDPLIWQEGAGTSDRRYLHADERGSITTVTDNAGGIIARNTYDDWGVPGAGNIGRFQYTGQQWLPEIALYYYKARFYNSREGRFMQTDPIGYEDGMNLYAYAGNDPVTFVDPAGTDRCAFKTCGTLGIEGMEASSELSLLAAASQPSRPTTDQYAQNRPQRRAGTSRDQAARDLMYRQAEGQLQILMPGTPPGLRSPGPVSQTALDSIQAQVRELRATPFQTTGEARSVANALGYYQVNQRSRGQAVFTDGRGNYITRDIPRGSTGRTDSGGVWKMANNPRGLESRITRAGTYNRDLSAWIGP